MIDQVDVADELHLPVLAPLGLQREILVADVFLALQFLEGDLAGGDVLERADLPEPPAQQLGVGVPEHLLQVRIAVGDLPRLRVQDEDAVLRGLEETAIADFRGFQRLLDLQALGCLGGSREGPSFEAAWPAARPFEPRVPAGWAALRPERQAGLAPGYSWELADGGHAISPNES